MKQFFIINGIDFTEFINERKYKMSRVDINRKWTDGNWTVRQSRMRQQIQGAFVMTFYSLEEYESFRNAVTAATNYEGWCAAKVYVTKENAIADIKAFIDYDNKIAWTNDAEPGAIEVRVEVLEI